MSSLINTFWFRVLQSGVHFLVFICCTGIAIGFALLYAHDSKPGLQFASPSLWPSDVEIERPMDVSSLLIFVHPQCPCTFASLAELERVVGQSGSSLETIVILNAPAEKLEEWMQTSVANRAKGISRARIVVDGDGKLSAKFRVTVSGQCLLYSPNGQLLFQGGLTASRGHEGESAGQSVLMHLIAHPERDALSNQQVREIPVYGCELTISHPLIAPCLPSATCGKGR